jgi:hypothetical protein
MACVQVDGCDLGDCHRAARWYMYREYVAAAFGYLGRGNRVTLPECVTSAIRDTFRAPGCNCPVGTGYGNIAQCLTHGYTGHRDAA